MTKSIEIHSIRDRDLLEILNYYHLDEAVNSGELLCHFCSRKITSDNIGALLVKQNGLVLYCDFSECLGEASNRGGTSDES
jgi:hypothetical protein